MRAHRGAVVSLRPIAGVNGLVTAGDDGFVKIWSADFANGTAGQLWAQVDTKKKRGSFDLPDLLAQSLLFLIQAYRVLQRVYDDSWEERQRAAKPAERPAHQEEKPRPTLSLLQPKPTEDAAKRSLWKERQRDGRTLFYRELYDLTDLERMAKEEAEKSLKVEQMVTPRALQPKSVQKELTQKPLDPYVVDSMFPMDGKPLGVEARDLIRTSMPLLEVLQQQGRPVESADLRDILNATEEVALKERNQKKRRRRFSAQGKPGTPAEPRSLLGREYDGRAAAREDEAARTAASAARAPKPKDASSNSTIKTTAMYQTFEHSVSMQDFHRSYKRKLRAQPQRSGPDVLSNTASSLLGMGSERNWTSERSTSSANTLRKARPAGGTSAPTLATDEFLPSGTMGSLQSMQSLPTLAGTQDTFFAPKGNQLTAQHSVRSAGPVDFAATASSFTVDLEDSKCFNVVSGRSYALSGRDVRFRSGEALRIMQRSTRASKSPSG